MTKKCLHAVVNSDAGYIGMIGSRRKIKLIFDDLIEMGVDPDPDGARSCAHRYRHRLQDGSRNRRQHRGAADTGSQHAEDGAASPRRWRLKRSRGARFKIPNDAVVLPYRDIRGAPDSP